MRKLRPLKLMLRDRFLDVTDLASKSCSKLSKMAELIEMSYSSPGHLSSVGKEDVPKTNGRKTFFQRLKGIFHFKKHKRDEVDKKHKVS